MVLDAIGSPRSFTTRVVSAIKIATGQRVPHPSENGSINLCLRTEPILTPNNNSMSRLDYPLCSRLISTIFKTLLEY